MVRELGSIDNPVLSLGPFFVEIGTGAPASSGGRDDKVRPSSQALAPTITALCFSLLRYSYPSMHRHPI